MLKCLGFGWLLIVSTSVSAALFESPVTRSDWQLHADVVQCVLTHEIEGYGKATFLRHANTPLSLTIETENFAATDETSQLSLISAPWKNTRLNESLATKPTQVGQRQFQFTDTPAKLALAGLQNGDFISMVYRSESRIEPITVHLSSVKFYLAMQNFQSCLASLHPDNFQAVDQLKVNFASGEAMLDSNALATLDRIAGYLKIDTTIDGVMIDSHTDNFGRLKFNTELSQQRADVVKNYLIENSGFDAAKIETHSHRDTRPLTDNKTATARAQNRRTEIRLIK